MTTNEQLPTVDSHDEVATLLPWYVNHTLKAEERTRVEFHIRQCPDCRRELKDLRALAERVVNAPIPERSPQLAYDRLLHLIQEREKPKQPLARPVRSESVRKRFIRPPMGARHHLVLQFLAAAILLLLVPLGWRQLAHWATPSYRTLSDPAPLAAAGQGDLRLVFDKQVEAGKIQALLKSVGGSSIGGAGPGDVYTIRLSGNGGSKPNLEAAIDYLRQQDGVLLVEPVVKP